MRTLTFFIMTVALVMTSNSSFAGSNYDYLVDRIRALESELSQCKKSSNGSVASSVTIRCDCIRNSFPVDFMGSFSGTGGNRAEAESNALLACRNYESQNRSYNAALRIVCN